MQFEEQIYIDATAEDIFALYADVPRWFDWDPDVKASSISGAFAPGAHGVLEPSNGPKAKILVRDVVANRSFTVTSKLPLCQMCFEHELSPSQSGTLAIHRITFSGLLSPVFGRLIGSQIRKGLPHTMSGLKRAAEQANNSFKPMPLRGTA